MKNSRPLGPLKKTKALSKHSENIDSTVHHQAKKKKVFGEEDIFIAMYWKLGFSVFSVNKDLTSYHEKDKLVHKVQVLE